MTHFKTCQVMVLMVAYGKRRYWTHMFSYRVGLKVSVLSGAIYVRPLIFAYAFADNVLVRLSRVHQMKDHQRL